MNTDYLKYNASSMVEYLRRCIIENKTYTDQLYPGSDTSLLINMFAWTFECLQYILNNNASDVLFQDSSLYENMNRMVKLLSYSPKAYTTSTAEFTINGLFDSSINADVTIPKYTKLITGIQDSNGNNISYSFIKDYTFQIKSGNIVRTSEKPILYNGEFYKYTFNVNASGKKYEVFEMTGIGPNEDIQTLIDNDSVNVYIEYSDNSGNIKYENVKIVDSLVMDASSDDLVCEKRLNENKELTLKFGDGIHGKILDKDTIVHLIYLKSNGVEGKIEPNQISSNTLQLYVNGFTDTYTLINMLFGGQDIFKAQYNFLFTNGSLYKFGTNMLTLSNDYASSDVIDYEDVDEIREYAPNSFRTGNRLVTSSDFRTYILNNFSNRVKDVYVCNNNEYCMSFYKWLDKYDSLNINIRLNGYEYSDANDFNNIYLWMLPNSEKLLNSDKKIIVKNCNNIKTITTNLVPFEGLKTYFTPYAEDEIDANQNFLSKSYYPNTYIIVEKERTYVSDENIKQKIVDIIFNYFDKNTKFGASINVYDIYNEILALNYIKSIKTVQCNSQTIDSINYNKNKYVNGLKFAAFTFDIVKFKDFEVFTSYKNLNNFQYPKFLLSKERLKSIIKITNENAFTLKNDEI